MQTTARLVSISFSFGLLAAACGGSSPAGPAGSPASGGGATSSAVIAGTATLASGANKAVHAINGVPAAGLTVTISGTSISATTNATGYFELTNVPGGTVRLQFRQSGIDATADVPNVAGQQLVTLEVQVSGSNAVIVSDARADAKVSLCHKAEGHGYHSITVSTDAEPAHRAHGDAKPGERVPGTALQTFSDTCQVVGPAVEIEKYTNGDDANSAPGPSIVVGEPVTWTYVVKNTGTVALNGVTVTDDKGVSVSCPATTLAPSQSMTCTGAGVATVGQYRNVGTVTATSTTGTVTDSDASHYLGVEPTEATGPKVELCHRTGNGSYHLISISVSAEPAHRAHGDARIGESVPGGTGVFGAGCAVR